MIRSKGVIATVLTLLLASGFLATTLISYFAAHDSLSRQIAEEALPLTSDNIYSEIQRDLLTPILISSLMATDTFVRDWAISGEQDVEPISRYLGEIQRKYQTITASFVSEATHNYYHANGIIKVVDPDDPADQWYFRSMRMKEPFEINIDRDTADRSRVSIFVNYQVRNYQDRLLGIIGVGLSLNSVVELIDLYERRYGRLIYFVNRQGDIVLHGSGDQLEERIHHRPGLAAYTTQLLTSPSTAMSYQAPGEGLVHLNSRLVPEFDWYLIVEQHVSQGEMRIERTLLVNILISIAVTAIILCLAYFTIRDYQRRLVEMATSDKLTGAVSRQVFDTLFERAVKSSLRRRSSLSLLVIDVDHFKGVNDQFGHLGGDTVLRSLTTTIRQHIRDSDTLCRWGGEEFLVLLEDCGRDEAVKKAEEIRNAIAAQPVPFGRESIDVTVSIGVTQYLQGETLDAVVHRADSAMYAAKRDGRNQVRVG